LNRVVLILIATIILAPYIARSFSTLKKFVSIPPQRLNVWILKARISSTDALTLNFNGSTACVATKAI
jgi:hypothetical protein